MKDKVSALIEIFNKAYSILKYTLDNPNNRYIREKAYERFEFTSYIFWKTLNLYIESEGLKHDNLHSSLDEARRMKIIKNDKLYFDMIKNKAKLKKLKNGELNKTYIILNEYSKNMKWTIDRMNSSLNN